jgi:3',5'-cyclic AMP phosphodiesterase CpdA
MGLNTARGTKTTYGHVSRKQLEVVRQKLCSVPDELTKIVVTHHPFDLPDGYHNTKQIVRRSERAMKVLAECGADLFLAGHLHTVFTRSNTERYTFSDYSALIIQAGTASALRKGPNTFNLLTIDSHELTVTRYDWLEQEKRFAASSSEAFRHNSDHGWLRAD